MCAFFFPFARTQVHGAAAVCDHIRRALGDSGDASVRVYVCELGDRPSVIVTVRPPGGMAGGIAGYPGTAWTGCGQPPPTGAPIAGGIGGIPACIPPCIPTGMPGMPGIPGPGIPAIGGIPCCGISPGTPWYP